MGSIIIVGNGYVGSRVAKIWSQTNPVTIVSRSDTNIPADLDWSFAQRDLDTNSADSLPNTADSILYYFVPPPRQGIHDPHIQNLLQSIDPAQLPKKLIFISTTGVYGDNHGDWVTEQTPPAPQFPRAHRRLHGETTLQYWAVAHGISWTILRLPAIYGPGKIPLEAVKSARPVICREHSPWVNRIYIDDLVSFCVAAGKKSEVEGIFNISDGNPALMTDYFFKIADVFGYARPPAITLNQAREEFSEGMLSYLLESRRIKADAAIKAFAVSLQYPDLDAGLAACSLDQSA